MHGGHCHLLLPQPMGRGCALQWLQERRNNLTETRSPSGPVRSTGAGFEQPGTHWARLRDQRGTDRFSVAGCMRPSGSQSSAACQGMTQAGAPA